MVFPLDLDRVLYFEHSLRLILLQYQIVLQGSALCHMTGELVSTTTLNRMSPISVNRMS